jgi:hypothetical protein
MSYDNCHDRGPPPLGPLGSTLSNLLGGLATSSTPAGGAATGRGESFALALLGGGYVVPGGYSDSGLARSGIAGATIVRSPSPGGSTAFEVMEELRDQVVSPITLEGGLFASPSVRAGVNVPLGDNGGLRLLMGALDMAAGGRFPAAPSIMTRGRLALSALDHTLKPLRRGTGNVGAARPNLQGDQQEWATGLEGPSVGGAAPRIQGQRSQYNPPNGEGSGDPGTLRLFRFDPRAHICGGLISRRGHHSSVLSKATSLVCRSLKIYLLK